MVVADRSVLFNLLAAVRPDNVKSEYYLTDLVGLAREQGLRVFDLKVAGPVRVEVTQA